MTLTPGQYVCVHGGGFAGWLIRTFTRAPVAHVIVYIGPQPNGHDAVEADPHGVRYTSLSNYDPKTSYPSTDELTELQSLGMVKTAIGLVGTPYGYLADVLIGLREGFGAFVPEWLFKVKGVASHMECAQLADYVALVNGVHYFDDGRQPGSVSPADLWRRDYPQ